MANRNNFTLDKGTMQALQDMLYRHHTSIQLYRQAYEITRDLPQDQDCTIALRFDSSCNKRCYNLPSAASREIAVIIPGPGEEHRDVHDIVPQRRGGGLKRINEMSPLHQVSSFCPPFSHWAVWLEPKPGAYPWRPNDAPDEDNDAQLLEPGEEPPPEGEVVAVRKKCKYMSQIEYFAYRLHPRHNESNHIFKAGHLFQEYIMDSWAAAEQSHLTWLRNNQQTLCSDVYKSLVDAVAENPDVEAQNLGYIPIYLFWKQPQHDPALPRCLSYQSSFQEC
jgi:hypothetical protein